MQINNENIRNFDIWDNTIVLQSKDNPDKLGYMITITNFNGKTKYEICRLIFGNGGEQHYLMSKETLEEALKYCLENKNKENEICFKWTKDFDEIELKEFLINNDIKIDSEKMKRGLDNSTCIITAWQGDLLIGIARYVGDKYFSANIDFVFVDKNFRGQGIGTQLVEKLLSSIFYEKYINVAPDNKELFSFYEKFGFHKIENGISMQIVR